MPKCGACGRFIAAAGAAQCSVCPGLYHRPCVAIPDNIIVSSAWRCPECTKNTPKGNNAATPVKGLEACNHSMSGGESELTCGAISEDHVIETGEGGAYEEVDERPSAPSLDDTAHNATQLFQVEFGLEVRFFREELRGLREEIRSEFRDLRRELVDIRTGLAACNCRADNIESRLQTLEQQMLTKGSPEVSILEQTVESLKLQINEREQDLLLTDIDISNLPDVRGENFTHTVVTLATKLGVSLEERDIVYAERVGARRAEGEAAAAAERGRWSAPAARRVAARRASGVVPRARASGLTALRGGSTSMSVSRGPLDISFTWRVRQPGVHNGSTHGRAMVASMCARQMESLPA